MAIENKNVVDDPNLNDVSHDGQNTPSEMKKPWMKTLGKEFYQNEELAEFDSLKDAVNSLLARPKAKDVPETYGYGDADELFKKASLTKQEADSIHGHYAKGMLEQKSLEEIFGENLKDGKSNFEKAMNYLGADADEVKKINLDKNPQFVKVMARFGKEIGPSVFTPSTKDGMKARVNYFEQIIRNGNNRGN